MGRSPEPELWWEGEDGVNVGNVSEASPGGVGTEDAEKSGPWAERADSGAGRGRAGGGQVEGGRSGLGEDE